MRELELARELTRAHRLVADLRHRVDTLERALAAANAALRPVAKAATPTAPPKLCKGFTESGQSVYADEPA